MVLPRWGLFQPSTKCKKYQPKGTSRSKFGPKNRTGYQAKIQDNRAYTPSPRKTLGAPFIRRATSFADSGCKNSRDMTLSARMNATYPHKINARGRIKSKGQMRTNGNAGCKEYSKYIPQAKITIPATVPTSVKAMP